MSPISNSVAIPSRPVSSSPAQTRRLYSIPNCNFIAAYQAAGKACLRSGNNTHLKNKQKEKS
jgi:hypothetical protein